MAGAETFASLGLSDAVGDDQPDGGGSETPRVLRLQTPYMRGEDVRELQSALVRNNFYPDRHGPNGGVDGVFGPKTEDAVRRYQMMNGLKVDGIAGPATLASLNLTSANDRKEDEVRQPRRVLRLQTPYMRGEDVRELQSALVKSHFYPDRSAASYGIDGIYGPKTSGAVRRYQIMHGLKVDGIAGPETFKSLRL
ncbi:peptidoglycan-binding domain-containing protein [Shouchella lonarensis]|uniref:peptidoglycan-binding domain-containing protein n=1 Tax=Shouchella lonarensis TaxID=1464122 RepID=UPI003F59F122